MSKKTEIKVEAEAVTEFKEGTEKPQTVTKFSKQQLIASKCYEHRRDLLTVLLMDDKEYSHTDVEALINDFMKGDK